MHPLVLLSAVLLCVAHCEGARNVQKRSVNRAAQKAIVKKHNELRAKVANGRQRNLPKAAYMPQLVWDNALARKAQAWADKYKFQHDNPSDRDTGRGYTGQNIGYASNQDPNLDWKGIIQVFYNEVSEFNPRNIDKYTFDDKTGHFTQVIWAKTKKIGCGYVRKKDGGNYVHLYGCNYLPGGNIVGQPIYKRI